MNTIIFTKWFDNDLSSIPNYTMSYRISLGSQELYQVRLYVQKGFYQLSEFTSASNQDTFMLEQVSRVGLPKIQIFEKSFGHPIGYLRGNQILDLDEKPILDIMDITKLRLPPPATLPTHALYDFGIQRHDNYECVAALRFLPGIARGRRWRRWLKRLSDIFAANHKGSIELAFLESSAIDRRLLIGAALLIDHRAGLQLSQIKSR